MREKELEKMKISLFDKSLKRKFYDVLSVISLVISFVLIFFDIPSKYKVISGGVFVGLLIVIYISMWIGANRTKKLNIRINSSNIEIREGDLFKEDGLKVIAFDEYLDTELGNRGAVTEHSINGQYLKNVCEDISALDARMDENEHLNRHIYAVRPREEGMKEKKFLLGTIHQEGDYLLMAFARLDKYNRSFLNMKDYARCLIRMWNECDIIYQGEDIVIPLLGAGLTRFKNNDRITEQELLELLLWTFRTCHFRINSYAKLKIVLTKDTIKRINLCAIEEQFAE
jgi:hypothetical protein